MNRLNNLLVEGGVGVGVQKIAEEKVEVLLALVGAPDGPPASSSSPLKGGLQWEPQQVHVPAIAWSKDKDFFFQTYWLTC